MCIHRRLLVVQVRIALLCMQWGTVNRSTIQHLMADCEIPCCGRIPVPRAIR